jgi:hypothetical protein
LRNFKEILFGKEDDAVDKGGTSWEQNLYKEEGRRKEEAKRKEAMNEEGRKKEGGRKVGRGRKKARKEPHAPGLRSCEFHTSVAY